jgi:hypothetical protein
MHWAGREGLGGEPLMIVARTPFRGRGQSLARFGVFY